MPIDNLHQRHVGVHSIFTADSNYVLCLQFYTALQAAAAVGETGLSSARRMSLSMSDSAQAATIASAQAEAHGTPDVHKAAPVGATEVLQAQKAASAPDRQSLQAVPLAEGQSTTSKGTAPEGERQKPAGKGVTSPDVMQNLATKAAVPADANESVQAQKAASQAGGQGPAAKGALLAANGKA